MPLAMPLDYCKFVHSLGDFGASTITCVASIVARNIGIGRVSRPGFRSHRRRVALYFLVSYGRQAIAG